MRLNFFILRSDFKICRENSVLYKYLFYFQSFQNRWMKHFLQVQSMPIWLFRKYEQLQKHAKQLR